MVGTSGSAKSSITNLIARFWDVQKGQITIGGIDIKDTMDPATTKDGLEDIEKINIYYQYRFV